MPRKKEDASLLNKMLLAPMRQMKRRAGPTKNQHEEHEHCGKREEKSGEKKRSALNERKGAQIATARGII